jgi:hypothetical protein
MTKTLYALLAAGTLATIAATPADARCRGCGFAADVAARAAIGSAVANRAAHTVSDVVQAAAKSPAGRPRASRDPYSVKSR